MSCHLCLSLLLYLMFSVVYSLWPLKFLAVGGGFMGLLFLPDPVLFGVYAEVARLLSFLWMVFQARNGVVIYNCYMIFVE